MAEKTTPLVPQFVLGEGTSSAPKSIIGIAPVDSYLVKYVDGEGREQTRIGFHVPQEDQEKDEFFIVQERIGNQWVVTGSESWFKTAVVDRIRRFLRRQQTGGEIGSV